jgi:PAS domain S-box-containing protein
MQMAGGQASAEWLIGGGELGALIRAKDWSTTPLGPRAGWPQPLRTALCLVVESRFPHALMWGRELFAFYNDAYAPFLGDRHPAALGRPSREVFPEYRDEAAVAAVFDRGETLHRSETLYRLSGAAPLTDAWYEANSSPVRLEDGTVGGVFVALHDTTAAVKSRRTEAALRESEEKLRVMFANTVIGCVRATPEGQFVDANPAFCQIVGRDLAELRTFRFLDLVHPDDRAANHDLAARMLAGEYPSFQVENRFLRDDTEVWVRKNVSVVRDESGAPRWIIALVEEIGARRKAEAALSESRALLQAIVDGTSDAVFVKDADGRYLLFNRAAGLVTGKAPSEVLGHDDTFLFPPEEARAVMARDRSVAASGETLTYDETLTQHGAGRKVFSVTKGALRDATNSTVRVFGISRDVTEARRAEQALRESEERFRRLVQISAQLVWTAGPDGRPVEESPSWRAFTGVSFLDGNFGDTIHPDDRERVQAAWRQAVSERVPLRCEKRLRHVSGEWREMISHAAPLFHPNGAVRGWIGMTADVTEKRRAEQALSASEVKFRRMVETADEGIAVTGPDGVYSYVNEKMAQIFGRPISEIIGKSSLDIASGEQRELIQRGRPMFARGETMRGEYALTRADGSTVSLLFSAVPLIDDSGRHLGNLVMHTDITERTQAEHALRASEERYRGLVEQMPDGVFVAGTDGRYLEVNRAGAEQLGLTQEEVLARTFLEMLPPEELARLAPFVELLADGKVHRAEWRARRQDGSYWIADVLGRRLRDGRLQGVVRDVTDSKRAEEALREANLRLEEADKRKDEFLGMLSHELRNPLMAIKSGLFAVGHAPPDSEPARRAYAMIDRQVGHLSRIVGDLLDVTRIARGKIHLHTERLDLDKLAALAVEDNRAAFDAAGVRLDLVRAPGPLWVEGDRTRLTQAIANLLQNAAKFTPRGGTTTVSLGEAERGKASVTVRDTGSGIAPELLPRVFEAFTQADSTLERSWGGLGLGLALVKAIMDLHGGSVNAASAGRDRGASFMLQLALAEAAAQEEKTPEPPPLVRRVLLVEDNRDVADALRHVLEFAGSTVEVARDGSDALLKASVFVPEVVLCDIGLPGMDGYEVARRIRANLQLQQPLLVALSGYARPEDVQRSRDAGFDAHFAKPTDLATLTRILATTAARR